MPRLPRSPRWMLSIAALFACILGIGVLRSMGSAAFAQSAPPPGAPAVEPQAELSRLADQVNRLDPKAANYPIRVKAILADLVRINQSLAGQNAILKAQQAAAPSSPRPRKQRAASGSGSSARAPGSAAAEVATGAQSGPLFGKRGLTKYHRVGCTFGERIKPGDRVYFATPAEAKAAGYEPCKICHPDSFAAPAPPAAQPKSP